MEAEYRLELPDPHGFLVWTGKRTAMLAREPLPEAHYLVTTGNKAWATVKLGPAAELAMKDLAGRQDEHQVKPEEAKAWWPGLERVWLQPFVQVERLDPPQALADNGKQAMPGMSDGHIGPADRTVEVGEVGTTAAGGLAEWLMRAMEQGFGQAAEDLAGAGYLSEDERATLKGAWAEAGGAFRAKLEERLGGLAGRTVGNVRKQAAVPAGLREQEGAGEAMQRGTKQVQGETEKARLEGRESREEEMTAVSRAFQSAFDFVKQTPDGGTIELNAWVMDTYEDALVVDLDGKTFRVNFSGDEDSGFTFDPPETWVEVKRSDEWLPVGVEAGSASRRAKARVTVGEAGLEPGRKQTKTEDGEEYGPEAYLYVPDKEDPGTWKLRIEETPGEVTVPQLGRAAAALGPGFRGQPVDLEDDERKAAARKLIAKYRAMDVEDTDIPDYLFEIGDMAQPEKQRQGGKAGRRLRSDKVGVLKEVQAAIRKLVKDLNQMLGWAEYRDGEVKSGVKVFEGPGGEPWLLTWTTNGFKDRDGETFRTEALEDYVKRHADQEEKGEFWFWHLPGTKFGTIAWQGMSGRFLVEAGPFDDTEIGRKFAGFLSEHAEGHPTIAPEGWGTSHGFTYKAGDREDGVYDWLEKHETTVLPGYLAANPYNPQLEVLTVDKKQREALEAIGGTKLATAVESLGEGKTKELEEAGVAFKAAEAEAEPKPVVEPAKEPEPAAASGFEAEVTEAIRALAAGTDARLKAMETAVAALVEASKGQAQAEAEPKAEKEAEADLTPRASLSAQVKSIIGQGEARVDGRTSLAKSKPQETEPGDDGKTGIPLVGRLKALNRAKLEVGASKPA